MYKELGRDFLNQHSIIPLEDSDRLTFANIFEFIKKSHNYHPSSLALPNPQVSRGVGSILGMAIADALGAST